MIVSRNGKRKLAFRGSFPSDAFSLWVAHFGHETDTPPVDLIWNNSMLIRQKFKFNGILVNPLFFQGRQNMSVGQRQNDNGWEIVSTYSTKEAVDDGLLVKVDS